MNRDLLIISQVVKFSLKSRFKDTVAGFIWVILNPIITYLIHCFLLAKILNINIPNVFVFLLGGVMPWTFFSTSIEMAIGQIVNAKNLLHSFNIKPKHMIFSSVTENFILFSISFTILLTVLSVLGQAKINLYYLMLPIFFSNLFFLTYFLASGISLLNIIYRDIKFITTFLINITFFMTPLLYPESFFPKDLKVMVNINPIYQALLPIREILTNKPLFDDVSFFYSPFLATLCCYFVYSFINKKYSSEFYKKI